MDRNTTIAFILIGGILVLWLFLNSPKAPPPQKGNKVDTTQVQHDTTTTQINKAPRQETPPKQKIASTKESKRDSVKSNANINYGKYFTYSDSTGRIITIENDLVKLELSTRGANIILFEEISQLVFRRC